MYKPFGVAQARSFTAILAVYLMIAVAHAQHPPPTQSQAATPVPAAVPTQPAGVPNPNDEMLARAGTLYYSTTKAGLDGFDCAVHPDWRALFLSAQPGVEVADDDARIGLLKGVKVTLHARMKGGSTLDWDPPSNGGKPLEKDSVDLLDSMHKATEQTFQGFLQFWIPFVDGTAVPSSSAGLEITKTEKGYRLHADQSGTQVTEELDNQLVLTQFKVVMSQVTVNFEPAYKSTEKGLLVNTFLAHITPAGAAPEQTQEMHVEIEYQDVEGYPIPAKLLMNVIKTGEFDFAMDGCTVTRQPK